MLPPNTPVLKRHWLRYHNSLACSILDAACFLFINFLQTASSADFPLPLLDVGYVNVGRRVGVKVRVRYNAKCMWTVFSDIMVRYPRLLIYFAITASLVRFSIQSVFWFFFCANRPLCRFPAATVGRGIRSVRAGSGCGWRASPQRGPLVTVLVS